MPTSDDPQATSDRATSDRAKKKTRAKWARRIVGGLLLLGAIGMIVWAYRPKPVGVEMATVERGTVEVRVREEGQTRVKDRYVISAPLSGRLLRLELEAGDSVQAGAVVARLVPVDAPLTDATVRAEASAGVHAARAAMLRADAAAERAQAQLAFAKQDAARQRGMHAKGAVSQRRLDEAELSVSTLEKELASARFGRRVAKSELAMAQAAERRVKGAKGSGAKGSRAKGSGAKGSRAADKGAFELVAPTAGRVLRVIQESEAVVPAGTPLLEVGDCGALEVVVDVLTSDAVTLSPGAAVALDRWGGSNTLQGRVLRVQPRAFTKRSALGIEEQRVSVVVEMVSPPEQWQALCDGYRVEAALLLETRSDVVRVPVGALFRDGSAWATYRVTAGRAEQVTVSPGSRSDTMVEITEGLATGDKVILFPSDRVTPGALVEPIR